MHHKPFSCSSEPCTGEAASAAGADPLGGLARRDFACFGGESQAEAENVN